MPDASETLLTASRFRVERIFEQRRDGTVASREVVRHPGAVAVLPLLTGDRVCLIRNFRPAVNRTLIEVPAGTLEPNEPPLITAARELHEETGYQAERLIPLAEFYLSPGILDERMHAFVATGLTAGPPQREPGERIENLEVDLSEALEMIARGEIVDAKTIVTLLYFHRYRGPR